MLCLDNQVTEEKRGGKALWGWDWVTGWGWGQYEPTLCLRKLGSGRGGTWHPAQGTRSRCENGAWERGLPPPTRLFPQKLPPVPTGPHPSQPCALG